MAAAGGYAERRDRIEAYFDRTAADAWARLTSDAPVGRIRRTVRAGRDEMRRTVLDWLPVDLSGRRVLDAGCGTGAFALEAARRGAEVVAVDHSATLVGLAGERAPADVRGRIDFRAGDMLDPALGRFDWVVAMDSIIHYRADDMADIVARFAERADRGVAVTFAPRTPLLALMHLVGRALPRGARSPDLEPVAEATLRRLLAARPALAPFDLGRSERVDVGFYKSQTLEAVRR